MSLSLQTTKHGAFITIQSVFVSDLSFILSFNEMFSLNV